MKHLKNLIIGLVLVGLIVGYYFYLSNRQVDNTEKVVSTNEEVSKLINRNLDGSYYPEFPGDVVKFYSRIVQAYYLTELSQKEIHALGMQARKLFDVELLGYNPEEEYFKNLEQDIEEYRKLERIIPDYTIESSSDIQTFTFQGDQYAKVTAAYMVREKGNFATIYQEYTLRKDKDGRWKILYWESVEPSEDD